MKHLLLLPLLLLAVSGSAALAVAEATPTVAADADAAFPPGEVVPEVTCRGEPSQSYALYLPSAYRLDRRWPVLVVMDPRGRAEMALNLFRDGAERHGYIVVSAHGTRSDGPQDVNVLALRALLPDILERFSIDRRRHYLAGFSGTARAAWDFAVLLPGQVAGVIGFGAGLPQGLELLPTMTFSFFGGAGSLDFNYDEMQALDQQLDGVPLSHRLEHFAGPHSWGPAEVCGRALDWMEIQAIRSALRDGGEAIITEIFSRERERAREMEQQGRIYAAYALYSALAEDFAGLQDTSEVAARATVLAQSTAVQRRRTVERQITADYTRYEDSFRRFLVEFQRAGSPPPLARLLRTLEVSSLQRRADKATDPAAEAAARRLLEKIFVSTSFYQPREFMAAGDPERAELALRIAGTIKPDHPRVCYGLARVHAGSGQKKKALESLACAARSGGVSAAFIEGDAALEPIRNEAGYREILQSLDSGSEASGSDGI